MAKYLKWAAALTCCCLLVIFTACSKDRDNKDEIKYKIYYVNYDGTGTISEEYSTKSKDTDTVTKELLAQLGAVPERLEYKAPLAGEFKLLSYSLSEGQLILNFDEAYKNQEIITEILVRAAIVRTLTQIKDVQYVSFLINSQPLADASGNMVGVMSADMFIDNAGNEISTYEKVKLHLYLANEEGDKLTSVTRTVIYNSNVSMERLIVEQLLSGPREGEKAYPTVNPETKIVSVNIKDGTCYVNLDSTFLTQIYNVTSEVTIYSLTNSLIELANVNRVQISINGDTNVNYKENISLSTVFERNLELVEP